MSFDLIKKELVNLEQRCAELSIQATTQKLIVLISEQKIFLVKDKLIVKSYTISTSKNPPSNKENSYGTPTGLHMIGEKIGDNQPIGTVFKARVPQPYTYLEAPEEEKNKNLITTRIIRLRGLDPKLNSGDTCDSFKRYIYIHGTNHENRLGKRFSNGCIELSNKDCIELFSLTKKDDLIWIK